MPTPLGRNQLWNLRCAAVFFALLLQSLMLQPVYGKDCSEFSIYLGSQSEVDSFQANYGYGTTCDTVVGNLLIGGDDIVDLTPLSALKTVGLALQVADTARLQSLSGLTNIASVGQLLIINNARLSSLNALSGISSVSHALAIEGNPELHNLEGLDQIAGSVEHLVINQNSNLLNIDSLAGLNEVRRLIGIYSNSKLTNLEGLINLYGGGVWLEIIGNPVLADLNGLAGLRQAGEITIIDNAILGSVDGLQGLLSLYRLSINRNPQLQTITGSNNLTEVDRVFIQHSPALFRISGFDKLVDVTDSIQILYNDQLTTIDGFQAVRRMLGALNIAANPQLAEISGFKSLTETGEAVVLAHLPLLPDISFLSSLETVGNTFELLELPLIVNLEPLAKLVSVGDLMEIRGLPKLKDVNGLRKLGHVGRDLVFNANQELLHFDGLASLASIGGTLHLVDNLALRQINGLSNLRTVGASVWITSNPELQNVDGLSGLSEVPDALYLAGNASLAHVDGLAGVKRVGGELTLSGNPSIVNFDGLAALTSVGETLYVEGNAALLNVSGIEGLASIGGGLVVTNNQKLATLNGFNELTTINGVVKIETNESMSEISGLKKLQAVLGDLRIRDNPRLGTVNGFSSLLEIGGELHVASNEKLLNINGFWNLHSIEGELYVRANRSLVNLHGLTNLTRVNEWVTIAYNESLQNCVGVKRLIDGVDDGATGPGPDPSGIPDIRLGSLNSIYINLEGCNSVAEILASDRKATVTVDHRFFDDVADQVGVTLVCDNANTKIEVAKGTASAAAPATFKLVFNGDALESRCNASINGLPPGYSVHANGCLNRMLTPGDSNTCQVTSSNSGSLLKAHLEYSDGNVAEATTNLGCTAGSIIAFEPEASSSMPAEFAISRIPATGANCTVSVALPPGYVVSSNECVAFPVSAGKDGSCRITAQQLPVRLTVNANLHEFPELSISTQLTCAATSITTVNGVISSGNPAEFWLSNFPSVGAHCTVRATINSHWLDTSDCEYMLLFPGSNRECNLAVTAFTPGRPPTMEGLTGSWYDPSTSGEGFMVHSTQSGTVVMYYYGFDKEGEPYWLLSQSSGPINYGEPIPFMTYAATGGAFQNFDRASITLEFWGFAEVTFEDCNKGVAWFSGLQGEKHLDVVRLGEVSGSHCHEQKVPAEAASVTGSWYEPATSGQGFSIHKISADRGVAYFYGYGDSSEHLWLIGTWNEPFGFGKQMTIPMKWVFGGTWDFIDPELIVRDDWGTLLLRFDDCDSGEAILEGIHGRQELDLVRLAGAFGLECTNPVP